MNLTLRQLQAFLAVADLNSFTRAAARMRMAQPALSLLIRELEASLGVRLFDRTTRRIELTEAGREFRASVSRIIDDLEHAARNIGDLRERNRGRVTIAAPPLLAAAMLPEAIAEFRRGYPGIAIAIVDTRTDLIVQRARTAEVDCGIGTFPQDEDGIVYTRVAADRLMLFCPADNALSRSRRIAWRELEGRPVIALTRDSGIRLLTEAVFESIGQSLRPAFEVSEVNTALGLVRAGLGLAVLPAYAQALASFQNLAARPLIRPSVTRDISIIAPLGRSLSPATEVFTRFLRTNVPQLMSKIGRE